MKKNWSIFLQKKNKKTGMFIVSLNQFWSHQREQKELTVTYFFCLNNF